MEFIVKKIKILNRIENISVLTATYLTGEEIYKDIVVTGYFKFIVNNKYKAKIIEENDKTIRIDYFSIEQTEIDSIVLNDVYKKTKQYLSLDDVYSLLLLNTLDDIKNKIDLQFNLYKNEIKEIIIKGYNENNLVKFCINNKIKNEEYIIKYSLKKFINIDIVKLFLERPYYLAIFGVANEKIVEICQINKEKNRLYSEIISYIKDYESLGNVYITKEELKSIIKDKSNEIHKLDDELIFLQNEGLTIINDDKIYLKDTYEIEKGVIDNLRKRLKIKEEVLNRKEKELLERSINQNNINLSIQQKSVIYECINHSLSIIIGGAGTGKTTLINGIITALKSINRDKTIEVVSLAGKASNVINSKLESNIDIRAKTVHSLLKIFNEYDDSTPVFKLDYLIIDEVSMIDLSLFYKLLSSIPIKTKIIMIGDINQAISIGLGQPVIDMIESKAITVFKLETNFRQDKNSIIALNAGKILNQESNLTYKIDQFEYLDVEPKSIVKNVVDKVKKLIDYGYSKDEIAILTLKRNKIDTLNEKIAIINTETFRENMKFVVDDKVIQNINNYSKNIYNGQVGKVLMIRNNNFETEITVDFNGAKVTYKNRQVEELDFAYSLTIHKMQGSQEKVVILVVEKDDEDYLNRNLIYTAITRATERFYVVGDMPTFKKCIRKLPSKKNSALRECLCKDI